MATVSQHALNGRRLRVVIQQPALPLYRIPVFRELNARGDIDLRVAYGCVPGLPNAEAKGFVALPSSERRWRLRGRTFLWDSAQWNFGRRRQSDVLVLTWNLNYLSLIPSLVRARASGIGCVLWGHGRSIGQSGLRAWIRSRAALLANTIICYGNAGAEENIALGVPAAKVYVAPNSLDERAPRREAARLRARPSELAAFQGREGVTPSRTILFVSRLQRRNRLDLVCEALRAVAAAIPDVSLVIIGDGEEERRRLTELAEARGVRQRVRFLGPIYEEELLAPWFMSASVLCYPENVGLSALHALAYGVPVVCGDDQRCHNPEVEAIVDGQSGRLFRRGNVADLARVLTEVLTDEAERERLSHGATAIVDGQYNVANMTAAMAAAIHAAASARNHNE